MPDGGRVEGPAPPETDPGTAPPPADFAAVGEAESRGWMSAASDLVLDLCRQWGLEREDERSWVVAEGGCNGVVMPVLRRSERCVLRVVWPPAKTAVEARALEAWGGRGAVRLLAARPEMGALLLERLAAERSLQRVPLSEAAEVAGRLLRRLAIPAPVGIPRLQEAAARTEASLPERQYRLGRPIPQRWVDAAKSLAGELGATAAQLLIHADLHYGNVLAGEREPWLAIDPKPVVGDPEVAVAEMLWGRLDETDGAPALRHLLSVLVDSAGLDAARARGWAVVRCVDYWLWGLENGLTEDPERCRRILEVLA